MPLILTRPRDLNHLTQQLQNLLRELDVGLNRRFAQTLQANQPLQATQPVQPSDVVRLQDLEELKVDILAKLDDLAPTSSSLTPITALTDVAAPLNFAEAPNGVVGAGGLTEFTPDNAPSTVGGRPVGVLDYKGRIYPYTATASPEVGYWTWDGGAGKVVLNAADSPEVGDRLEFAMAILA